MSDTNLAEKIKDIDTPQTSGNDEVSLLRRKNLELMQDMNPQGLLFLQKTIENNKKLSDQQNINDYLELIKSDPLHEDFFIPTGTDAQSHIQKMLNSPSPLLIKEASILIETRNKRIEKYKKYSGETFQGKNTNDLVKAIWKFHTETIFKRSPIPGKGLLTQIDPSGEKDFMLSISEANLNLSNTQKIADIGLNVFMYLDYFEDIIKKKKTERKKELIKASGENIRKAKENPTLFTKNYIQNLEETNKNLLNPHSKNPVPIELILDFDKHILKEQKKKRLGLEKKIAQEWKKHSRLLGPKNINKWERSWIKEASIDELNSWDKPQGRFGSKSEFEKLIHRRLQYEKEFKSELAKYPASNKKEYEQWFYAMFDEIDGDLSNEKMKISDVFAYLEEKMKKVKEAHASANELIVQKQEMLTVEELKGLKNISDLSRTEQEKLIQETQNSVQKREHILNKFNRKEKTFKREIQKYEDGLSHSSLEDILSPILEIKKELEESSCPKNLEALRTCEIIETDYLEDEKGFEEMDFAKFLEEDETMAALILSLTYSEKHEDEHRHDSLENTINEKTLKNNSESKDSLIDAIKDSKESYLSQTAANDSTYEDPDEKRAYIQALKLENNLVNESDFIQNEIAENPSIQERYEKKEEEKKEKILSSNESIADQVQDTNKNVVVRLSDYRDPAQVLQHETQNSLIKASQVGNIVYAESSGKKMTQEKKKKGLKNVVFDRFKKFFGERQAKKANVGEHELWDTMIRDRKSRMSDSDSYETAKSKLKSDSKRLDSKMKKAV